MLIYSDRSCPETTRAALHSLASCIDAAGAADRPNHDDVVDALVAAGVFEAAAADAICPHRESGVPVLRTLRRASECLGRALAESCTGTRNDARRWIREAERALCDVDASCLPSTLQLRTPEGYAFYALYPESYVDAAIEWVRNRRVHHVICLGLRSIGTSLSAAVHGALLQQSVSSTTWTVRPHGHPFDRQVAIEPDLLREWDLARATFLLVDEGPGLSGSSLAGTAQCLARSGASPEQIVFLAAWRPDPVQLNSDTARDAWRRHDVITGGFERVRDRVLPAGETRLDWSAGRWRHALLDVDCWPAAHPQHERVKVVVPNANIVRFAGLGSYGRAACTRAARIAEAGYSPEPVSFRRGFLTLQFAPGAPATRSEVDRALLDRAADYLAWLRRHEATTSRASVENLAEMLAVNVREALGAEYVDAATGLVENARVFDEPAVAIDGRMLLHEWVRSGDSVMKVDALDHHRDHFMPGIADISWDVAGFVVEGGLGDSRRERFVQRYASRSGDATIAERLPFYTAAYLAFRTGYCAMAEQSLTCAAERERFARARMRYERTLRHALAGA